MAFVSSESGVRESAESVVVRAGQLGQAESVEGVGLATRGSEPGTGGLRLVGVYSHLRQPRFQQVLDQHALGALDGDSNDAVVDERAAKPNEAPLVVDVMSLVDPRPEPVDHANRMLVLGPVDAGARVWHEKPPLLARLRCGEADGRLPLRMLMGRCSKPRRPVAASGAPSYRREAPV